jgi:hypothetical protein
LRLAKIRLQSSVPRVKLNWAGGDRYAVIIL